MSSISALQSCPGAKTWCFAGLPSLVQVLVCVTALCGAAFALGGPVPYQPARLTAEDYAKASRFIANARAAQVKNQHVAAHWLGDSDMLWYVREYAEGWQYVLVDAASGEKRAAFDHSKIAQVLTEASDTSEVSAQQLPIADLFLDPSLHLMHFNAFSQRWTCELPQYSCSSQPVLVATPGSILSPDANLEVFRRDRNLWLRERTSGQERPLTTDGEQFNECGWVSGEFQVYAYLEQNAAVVPPMVNFSPDGNKILVHCYDERAVRTDTLWQGAPPDGSRPKLYQFKVSRSGDEHIPLQKLKVFDLVSGDSQTIDKPAEFQVLYGATSEDIWWTEDSQGIYFLAADRYQKTGRLYFQDVKTKKLRVVMEERSKTQLNFKNATVAFPGHSVRVLSNGDFVWFSERSGWGHLYLYGKNGRLKKQLTRGEWVVYEVVDVDEERGVVTIIGSGREEGSSPYHQRFYQLALDGSSIELLTPEDAYHQIPAARPFDQGTTQPIAATAPSGNFFVARMSTADSLASTVLRTSSGKLVTILETADPGELMPEPWVAPVPFTAKAADGATDVYGTMILPSHFDPSLKYPVIDFTYSAPFYMNSNMDAAFNRGHLLFQGIAELGFVVVQVHGRGTPGRSKAFQDYSYNNLQSGPGIEDHAAAIRQLAERYSYVDIDRVGVIGFSSGGYNTALAMLDHGDLYKVGVAGVPGIDYSELVRQVLERYQGPPGEDRVNYQGITLADRAEKLTGKLLIVYSDLDENATPGPIVRFIAALTEANRNYDLILMPNQRHSAAIHPYAIRRTLDYFVEHLMGSEPPAPH